MRVRYRSNPGIFDRGHVGISKDTTARKYPKGRGSSSVLGDGARDRQMEGIDMRVIRGYIAVVVAVLQAFGFSAFDASAKAVDSTDVIVQLRVGGDTEASRPIRSCLAEKLSRMPDVKVADASTDGTRFVVDVVAAKGANKKVSASVVVAEIFPMEQFRPRMREGEDAEAILTTIQYYTLLRLHRVVRAQSHETLCQSVVADIAAKVLSEEFIARND